MDDGTTETLEEPVVPRDTSHMRWYALGTFSGYENRAKQLLLDNIQNQKLQDSFGDILIPTEEVVELRGGAKRTTQRKLMPGYIFLHMEMNATTWFMVKETPKVLGFIGDDKNPKPMNKREVKALTAQTEEGTARPKAAQMFEEGTQVRVVDGPFLNFSGVIEDVMAAKQKVRVLVSIFGRATPVELDFMQVERM